MRPERPWDFRRSLRAHRRTFRPFCLVGLMAFGMLALATSAGAQATVTSFHATNDSTADLDEAINHGGLDLGRKLRGSEVTAYSTGPYGGHLQFGVLGDLDLQALFIDNTSNPNSGQVFSDHRMTLRFDVTAPGKYAITVEQILRGALSSFDDNVLNNPGYAWIGPCPGGNSAFIDGAGVGWRGSLDPLPAVLWEEDHSVFDKRAFAVIDGTSNGTLVDHTLYLCLTSEALSRTTSETIDPIFPWGDSTERVSMGTEATVRGGWDHDRLYPGHPGLFSPSLDGLIVAVTVESVPELCGNGDLDSGESCDFGTQNGMENSCCSASCGLLADPCDQPTCGNGVGDLGENCDLGFALNGAPGSCCGSDCLITGGAVCREKAGPCDRAETCGGFSPICPADTFLAAGSNCRNAGGHCDQAESCDGTSISCPANTFEPAGFVCREATEGCDVDEVCSGTNQRCPDDTFLAAGTICRSAGGACHTGDVCNGTSRVCAGNGFVSAGTLCRAAAGDCDEPESCTGADFHCPPDYISSAETVCRPQDGVCDVLETCTGVNRDCPADEFELFGTVCRPSSGDSCDLPELCTGATPECTPDDQTGGCTPNYYLLDSAGDVYSYPSDQDLALRANETFIGHPDLSGTTGVQNSLASDANYIYILDVLSNLNRLSVDADLSNFTLTYLGSPGSGFNNSIASDGVLFYRLDDVGNLYSFPSAADLGANTNGTWLGAPGPGVTGAGTSIASDGVLFYRLDAGGSLYSFPSAAALATNTGATLLCSPCAIGTGLETALYMTPLAPACSDGRDNDGDGFCDTATGTCLDGSTPGDPGCTGDPQGSERSDTLPCDDGLDNELVPDGLIDYPADPVCTSPTFGTESADCQDGIDNDGDGRVDYDPLCDLGPVGDCGCESLNDPSELDETGTYPCDDGIDNDGDGLSDLEDPGCDDEIDDSERSPALVCDNGLDDDLDGSTDFDPLTFADPAQGVGDPGCRSPTRIFEKPQCQDGLNNDNEAGIDFDGGASLDLDSDGFVDAQFNAATPAVGPADPQCVNRPWRNTEAASWGCGMGFELALLLPGLMWLRRRGRGHQRA